MSVRTWAKALLLGLFLSAGANCLAQNQQQGDDNSRGAAGYNAIVDNLDLLIDNYARFLAKRYDLTPEQDEYTKTMLREQAYKFLEKHDTELRSVIERMFDVRAGGQMTPQELMDWGRKAEPLYQEAKELIVNGNNDWRSILTEEQKKTHDEDLRQMHDQFSQTDDQVKRMVEGKMTVDEFRNPNRSRSPAANRPAGKPVKVGSQPAAPPPGGEQSAGGQTQPPGTASPGGQASILPANTARNRPTPAASAPAVAESEWEKYVREFIERFKLDQDQQQRANSILKESQEQANTYRDSKRADIEALDKKIAEINQSKDKDKAKQLADANKQREKLMEPVNKIFEKLKSRLDQIPTRAQRTAAAEAKPAKPASQPAKEPRVKTGTSNHPRPKPTPKNNPPGDNGKPADDGGKPADDGNPQPAPADDGEANGGGGG